MAKNVKTNQCIQCKKMVCRTNPSYGNDIAIDMGSSNTIVSTRDLILINEPSLVAYNKIDQKVIAVGRKALEMYEKCTPEIEIIHPIIDGAITDNEMAEYLLKGLLKPLHFHSHLFAHRRRMVFCIPFGINRVERKAALECAKSIGAKKVKMIPAPLAIALGANIDIMQPSGYIIVNIGAGRTEIAAISFGEIIKCTSIKSSAGNVFNEKIVTHMQMHHNLKIGIRTAEEMKVLFGAAVENELENALEETPFVGKDLLTGLGKAQTIGFNDIAHALDNSIKIIEQAIVDMIASLPPEIIADIYRNGIYLAGGGASLRGLTKRISERTKTDVHVIDDPSNAAIKGARIALEKFDDFRFFIK